MKKTIKIALFILSSTTLLVGCGAEPEGSKVSEEVKLITEVNIGSFSRAIDYAPYIVAKNNGLFDGVAKKHGVTVNYVEFQTLPAINESLATDNLDIVFEAEPPAIIGRAAGMDINIVSSGVSLVQEIVIPFESDIKEIADLKGKKIAVPSGSSSHYGLNMILKGAGLTGDDVEIIDMNPQDGKAAFVARRIDGWAIWPPFVEQEEYAKTGRVLRGSNVFIQSIMAMRGGFKKDNPELAKDLVMAVKESQKWIFDNSTEAQKIVADELDIELGVVELAWGKHNFNPTIGAEEITDIQNKADFLFRMGLVKTKVDAANDLIDLF